MLLSLTPLRLKAFATIFYNLSSASFGVGFLTPGFLQQPDWPIHLLIYLVYGIVFLIIGIYLDELAQKSWITWTLLESAP